MKEILKKLSDKFKVVFGYGIMITLFVGGLTFLGYIAALVVGGDAAVTICAVIFEKIIPVMVYVTTCLVLFGLLSMYMAGEFALTTEKKNSKKNEKQIIEDKTL